MRWEMQKLWQTPMLWVFLALCLAWNALLMGDAYGADWVRFVGQTNRETGGRMGAEYDAALAALPPSESLAVLREQTEGARDIFEGYDVSELARRTVQNYGFDGWYRERLEAKYEALRPVVERLAREDASLHVYAAGLTYDRHSALFGTLIHALLTEGVLLAALCTIYLMGYEQLHGTEHLLYATKTGRRIARRKLAAGVVASLCGFVVLCGITLSIEFAVWDYGGLWNANVSSQFNHVREFFGIKPFIPWTSFALWQYLLCVLGLCALLCIVFALIGSIVGLWAKNAYMGFLVIVLGFCAMVAAPFFLSSLRWWRPFFASQLTPAMLWFSQPLWLTEQGAGALYPWQETHAVLWNLLVFGLASIGALHRFCGKETI